MRRLLGLVLLVLVTGCTTESVGGDPQRTEAPTGPVDLAVPLELARVLPTPSPSVPPSPGPDGVPLTIDEEPFLTITRLDGAKTQLDQNTGQWTLIITLTEDDSATFAEWTGEHIGEQAAIIVDGEIVSAPQIQSEIPGPEVQISGDFTRDDVEGLLHDLTGR